MDGFFCISTTDVHLRALLVELCREVFEDQESKAVSATCISESERTFTTTSPGFAESK